MATKDKRTDAYIAKSADFAKPILCHLRELVHKACPDVEEKMKWSFPHFDYKGMMCSVAAFKEHCAFGFWKASLMKDATKFMRVGETGMGQLGKIKSLDDLPSDRVLLSYIKEAVKLNDAGTKLPARKQTPAGKKDLRVPEDLKKALSKSKRAQTTFNGFSYSNKKEYVEWLAEAKTDPTRAKRLATAIEWMAEGKIRNWKYVK
jgi:uncharacterized protein YdeI (YjbR/CyaY-like superfamily)